MSFVGKRILGVLLILILGSTTAFCQEKTYFSDSTSFFEFLSNQEQVPGLKFRFTLPANFQLPAKDTAIWNRADLGMWYSNSIDSISQLKRFRSGLDSILASSADFQYLIYDEPSTEEAASEFVSALLRSNDIFPAEKKNINSQDLVLLAQDSPFQPGFNVGFGYFSDFKIFMIALIITVFFLIAGGMIFFMILFKSGRNRREQLRSDFEKEISSPLSQILFNLSLEEIKNLPNEEIEIYFPAHRLSNKLFKEVLIENIISLNKKMKGDFKDKLKALFKRLGLYKISESKVNSKKWDAIVSGLIQINEMDLEEFLPLVKKHLNSPNFHIRTNAAATLLNLSREVDLSFLKNQKYPLSNWQQMNYLRIIKYLYPTRKLLMVSLFDSENITVRLFGYKLVRMVGRVDLVEKIGGIATTASDEEKIEILKTIQVLGVPSYTALINSSMQSTNDKLSRQAIKAAGSLGDKSSEQIILELLAQNRRFEIKMLLMESLKKLNYESFKTYVLNEEDQDTQAIYHHLEDPLLSYV